MGNVHFGKRLGLVLLSLLVAAASLAGCGKGKTEEQELVVFAAASMNKVLPEIAEAYREMHPETSIVFTFDSSGTLKTQIAEGAYCDIFVSAGQKQMNAIDREKNEDGLDFVLAGTRIDLLENQVVLVVPKGNPAGITSFDDLASDRLKLMAIGNSDVPVGQYAEEILSFLGLYDQLNGAGKLTFGSNTTEVTSQIAEGAVDCGIVYGTDVASAIDPSALEVVAAAPEGSVSRVIYPAAVLNGSKAQDAAKAFLAFLEGDAAKALLEKYGFTPDFD